LQVLFYEIVGKYRQGGKIINRDIEEALYLIGMKIHANDTVSTGSLKKVGNQFCGNGLSGRGFTILSGIPIIRHYDID
jgi:hypothetical protein